MSLIIYMASVWMVVTVGQPSSKEGSSEFDPELAERYGTILRSSFSFWQMITADDWFKHLARPVILQDPVMIIFFVSFLVACKYGLMLGVVISIITVLTLSRASQNTEEIARSEEKKARERILILNRVFVGG